MRDVTAYVEDRKTSEFYPTPEKLVNRMFDKVKWDLVQTILEPSDGKGDIVRGIATAPMRDYHKDRLDVDCIELDTNLRAILKYSFSEEAKREIFDNMKKRRLTKMPITDRYGNALKKPEQKPTVQQSLDAWALLNELLVLGYPHNFQHEASHISGYLYNISALIDKAYKIKREADEDAGND